MEFSTEKKAYLEKKRMFRQKVKGGNLERNTMTMFDFIFWNPRENPMPGRQQQERRQSVSSSRTDEDCTLEEIHDEEAIENENLDPDANATTLEAEIGENVNSSIEGNKENTENVEPTDSSPNGDDEEDADTDEPAVFAPKVKIGPNGELIIDEKSITIKTAAEKKRDQIYANIEVIEENDDDIHYGRYNKRRKRSTEWTLKETARFYKALSSVGTDFTLMETVFAWRSRAELKLKFKKEERKNKNLVDKALMDCTQFDFSIFDESDYDPEEDRKLSKEAEKLEAKKKKDVEKEERKKLREKEKQKKKDSKAQEKSRKQILRQTFKKRKRRVVLPIPDDNDDSNQSAATSIMVDAHELIFEVTLVDDKEKTIDEEEANSVFTPTPEYCTGIPDICTPAPDCCNPDPDSCTPTPDSCKPPPDSCSPVQDNCTPAPDSSTLSNNSEGVPTKEVSEKVFPVSLVQTDIDGKHFIELKTEEHTKNIPVPSLTNQTTHVVVVVTKVPEEERVYHVYLVSAPQEDKR